MEIINNCASGVRELSNMDMFYLTCRNALLVIDKILALGSNHKPIKQEHFNELNRAMSDLMDITPEDKDEEETIETILAFIMDNRKLASELNKALFVKEIKEDPCKFINDESEFIFA